MAIVDTKLRVKLFLRIDAERKWVDRGTGHVSWLYNEEQRCMSLIVKSENDGPTLLEAQMLPSIAYERQQVKNP